MEHSSEDPGTLTPHGVISQRVKDLRTGLGWSAERLAAEMAKVGVPWTRVVVTKLETGRRPGVSVEELFALAYVLSVAPVHLMVPPVGADDMTPYRLIPGGEVHSVRSVPAYVRAWIRGQSPVGATDAKRYFAEVPDSEWQPPANQWTPDNIKAQSDAVKAVRPELAIRDEPPPPGGEHGER